MENIESYVHIANYYGKYKLATLYFHNCFISTEPKHYLFDAGCEEPLENLITALNFLGIVNEQKQFKLAGMIISPAYKYLGLQQLLENYNFEPFSLLTNFHFVDAHCLKGHELDVDKHDKFGSNSYVNDVFDKAPLRLLYSSSHPLTKYKMEWHASLVKERSLLEDAYEKLEKPCAIQTNHDDFSQIFLSGNMPVDQMILREYSFLVFQVSHHKQRPKLAIEVRSCFPSQELIENAAKLMALYNYRHILWGRN